MPRRLETAEWWKDQADEARAERDHLALRLEEVKAEAQNQREHAHRALDERDAFRGELERVKADREELVTFANANTNKLMAELEDLRDRLAKAGARLSTVEGSRVEAQVEAEATTKATAVRRMDEVIDEALVALDVTEDWLAGMDQPGAFRRILEEARVRMTARISAIDDFSAEEPF